MANVQHSAFTHADVHEPRHISLNGASASGKVITNSSTAGESEYRRLAQADLLDLEALLTVEEFTSTTAQTHYIPMDFDGTIVQWIAVVNNALVTASNTYELRIDGVQVTSSPITFAISGAAGDQQSAVAPGAHTFTSGANTEVVGTTIGNTDATVATRFMITVQR
jgi:hypothetical protein